MSNRYDALIIGGGHNGLVCAFYLAKAGMKVRVLERRDIVGGDVASAEGGLPEVRAGPQALAQVAGAGW